MEEFGLSWKTLWEKLQHNGKTEWIRRKNKNMSGTPISNMKTT